MYNAFLRTVLLLLLLLLLKEIQIKLFLGVVSILQRIILPPVVSWKIKSPGLPVRSKSVTRTWLSLARHFRNRE